MWRIPYTDFYWGTLQPMQWRFFAEHVRLDQQEQMEINRDLAEYAMAFHNFQGVQSVQKAREQEKMNQDQALGDIFAQQVANLFNRDLDFDQIAEARSNPLAEEIPPEIYVAPAPHKSARDFIKQDTVRIARPSPPPTQQPPMAPVAFKEDIPKDK